MIKMINADFDNEMWVAENRVEEYLEAGHKLASDAVETDESETMTDRAPDEAEETEPAETEEIAPAQKKQSPAKKAAGKTGKRS